MNQLKTNSHFEFILTKKLNEFKKIQQSFNHNEDDFFMYSHIFKQKQKKNLSIPLYLAENTDLWTTNKYNILKLPFVFYLIKGSRFNEKNNAFIETIISEKFNLTEIPDLLDFVCMLQIENQKLKNIDFSYFNIINQELYTFTKFNLECINPQLNFLKIMQQKEHSFEILSIFANNIDAFNSSGHSSFSYDVAKIINNQIIKDNLETHPDYPTLVVFALNHDKVLFNQTKTVFYELLLNNRFNNYDTNEILSNQINILSHSQPEIFIKLSKHLLDQGLEIQSQKNNYRL